MSPTLKSLVPIPVIVACSSSEVAAIITFVLLFATSSNVYTNVSLLNSGTDIPSTVNVAAFALFEAASLVTVTV